MSIILHIPHSSQHIPKEYLPYFLLNKETLKIELLKMTDHYTSELFLLENNSISTITFSVSRLLVDPERFENDLQEPMTDLGMGCIYTKTHDQKPLKEIHKIKNELISKFYRPHHQKQEGPCFLQLALQYLPYQLRLNIPHLSYQNQISNM